MNTLFKLFFSRWGNLYLIIGIFMGLSVSLSFLPPDVIDGSETLEFSTLFDLRVDDIDEYEPRINTYNKPQQAQKVPKTLIRPRYYSTELGIKEKLFVGVITSREYLHDRDVALNKTMAHLVDKIRYFISIPEGTKPNVSLPGIVGFTDTRSILKPFHAMKYIVDNYLEDYNYYFLIKDAAYVNARRLMEFVEKISVRQDVHMGVVGDREPYCSLDSGILLSNSIIHELKTNLDWCVKNVYSDSDDVNFGRCILHATSISCYNEIQGQRFLSTRLSPTFNFEQEFSQLITDDHFERSLTVYPVYDHLMVYKMNVYFAAMRAIRVQEQITETRSAISKTANLGPERDRNVTWPIGNQPGNKPSGRFDVLRWTYFNETHSFLDGDFSNVKTLKGDAKFDVDRTINAAADYIEQNYKGKLKFKRLVNGYRRFDASRGMDYILDLSFTDTSTGSEINKRIEVCKPLGKVEILPVPYVTENTRINVILTIDLLKKQEALDFMEKYSRDCMEKKFKTFLMIVLLYDPDSPSKGKEDIFRDVKKYALALTEKYKKDQSKVTWLSVRLPVSINSTELEPMLKVAVADLCARKFSSESLLLFVETGLELRMDYLNRVRMNTIAQYQVFSPIPFVEFHPDVIYANEARSDIDINRNQGRYDEHNYNSIAFYVKDYNSIRKTVESSIPLARSDKDISTLLKLSQHSPITSLFEMFVSFSDFHAFRAVEPALRIKYKEIECSRAYNENVQEACIRSRSFHLGRRGQLARLIIDYQTRRDEMQETSERKKKEQSI